MEKILRDIPLQTNSPGWLEAWELFAEQNGLKLYCYSKGWTVSRLWFDSDYKSDDEYVELVKNLGTFCQQVGIKPMRIKQEGQEIIVTVEHVSNG